jgi:hypothetical protein
LVDGSTISEPGATGSTWRLHYALNLATLSCDEVHVTEANEGESLTRFKIQAGDIVMGTSINSPPILVHARRR